MPYKKTHDILDCAKAFHRQISELYHNLSAEAEKEKVKMLLDYLSRHEKNLAKKIEGCEEDASRKILKNCFKLMPNVSVANCFEDMEVTPSMSVDDVIRLALSFDDWLVDLFTEAARNSQSEELRDVFNSLLVSEKEEEIVLLRTALEVKQI